ncbi:hypothetical protein CP975_32295 [Streptomyces alboniger]|uniref:Uncharacterized protein n=2 Tax=Streptomyces alboniger TaxID=132473 RepID=A0A5J6HTF9_STRAD|nr:hypothetical protein CP975_32295 [Streptomyces alboniger]
MDVDDEAAAKIIVDDRTSDLAGYDILLLADILPDLPDLKGTGYDQDQLDQLLDATALPEPIELPTDGAARTHGPKSRPRAAAAKTARRKRADVHRSEFAPRADRCDVPLHLADESFWPSAGWVPSVGIEVACRFANGTLVS